MLKDGLRNVVYFFVYIELWQRRVVHKVMALVFFEPLPFPYVAKLVGKLIIICALL